MNCFRYLDYKSLAEVDRITLPEYRLLMQAVRLKQFDLDYRNHLQAYLNFAVKAEKKSGKNKAKPVFDKFVRFFDYKARLREAERGNEPPKPRFPGISKFLKKGG